MNEIRISPLGFVLLDVDIRSMLSPKMESIRYKVDTGANRTTISTKKLSELVFDGDWV